MDIEFIPFAKRSYKELTYTVNPKITNMELRHRLKDAITESGEDNMYMIILDGYRNPDFEIYPSDIEGLGNIVSVQDETVPDFDFEELYEENKDNILGMFIQKHLDHEPLSPLEQKTLYYGTKALLDAMEDRI